MKLTRHLLTRKDCLQFLQPASTGQCWQSADLPLKISNKPCTMALIFHHAFLKGRGYGRFY